MIEAIKILESNKHFITYEIELTCGHKFQHDLPLTSHKRHMSLAEEILMIITLIDINSSQHHTCKTPCSYFDEPIPPATPE